MSKILILFVYSITTLFAIGECIVCTEKICDGATCNPVKDCNGSNQVIQPGGICACCPTCYTFLNEDDPCPHLLTGIRGGPPPTTICGKGLTCLNGVCTQNPGATTRAK